MSTTELPTRSHKAMVSALCVTLLANTCCAQEQRTGQQPGDTTAPAAEESDKRLHADGKGWKLEKAVVVDKQRPRVLLIGDSILSGYKNQVINALKGRAYVDAWVNPYHQSEHLTKVLLPEILANGPYDAVHFNMGLHGWQEGRIKDGTFEPLTKAYVQTIRKTLPEAAIGGRERRRGALYLCRLAFRFGGLALVHESVTLPKAQIMNKNTKTTIATANTPVARPSPRKDWWPDPFI
jgi:hypothetical protein